MKDSKGGMRSAKMPSSQFERNEGEMGKECKLKYASEFGNPKDYDKNSKALADYAKKNQMKY